MDANLKTLIDNTQPFAGCYVRTTVVKKRVWFCAKDVYDALGLKWKGSASMSIPAKYKIIDTVETNGGYQEAVFISEGATVIICVRSRKPQSLAFVDWLFEDLLPAISAFPNTPIPDT